MRGHVRCGPLSARLTLANRDIIVIGASAGGVEALIKVTKGLPPSLPAAVFVVLHTPQDGSSALPQLLARSGVIPVEAARDGAAIVPGRMYVAPNGSHLLVGSHHMSLGRGPRENGHRPAVDVLFRSAARAHGSRVIGVVLSGTGDDGTAGLQLIKACGGFTVVQDPADATYADMPRSAAAYVPIDATSSAAELPILLTRVAREAQAVGAGSSATAAADQAEEAGKIRDDKTDQEQGDRMNESSVLSCPDCGGVLWEMREGQLIRYRCHVGHAYTLHSLAAGKAEALETAMWTAVRMFRERGMLSRRAATRARERGMEFLVANLEGRAEDADRCATLIEGMLGQEHVGGLGSVESPEAG